MKNQSTVVVCFLGIFIASAIGYSILNRNSPLASNNSNADIVQPGQHRMPDGSLMENETTNDEMGMMGGMDHSAMMVKSERAFLEGMLPHHLEAVDTAKEVIARGGSTPEIKELAESIVSAQEKEIAMMTAWYQTWYGKAYVKNPEGYKPMMRDLGSLNGKSLDRVFLEDMVMHHMGAVMMAQSVQPYIEHTEITDLTKDIVKTQTAEIQLMKQLITDL